MTAPPASPVFSPISMLAPSMVPMMKEPLRANFMLLVPLASVPAVEMCWLQHGQESGEMVRVGQASACRCCGYTELERLVQGEATPQLKHIHQPHLSSAAGMMTSASDTL